MSVTSTRQVIVAFQGDVTYNQEFDAVVTTTGPGSQFLQALTSGNNTITVPSSTGVTGVTIVPLSTNTVAITLKGVAGDTGISIALTSPTSLGLNGVSSFVLNTSTAQNIRIIYT
jgi:hypothetical protein